MQPELQHYVPLLMTRKFLFALILGFSFSFAKGQEAQTLNMKELHAFINAPSEKVKVINFWATWCAPCIEELPLFETLNSTGTADVTLVSLDLDLDPNPEKVYKFVKRKNLHSRILLLNQPDPNSWISKIDKTWSGALPATLIVNSVTGKRKFIEKPLHKGDLETIISEVSK